MNVAEIRARDIDKCGEAPEAAALMSEDAAAGRAVAVASAPAMNAAVAEENSVVGVWSEKVCRERVVWERRQRQR